nr:hypothetical protein 2 [bacterium]
MSKPRRLEFSFWLCGGTQPKSLGRGETFYLVVLGFTIKKTQLFCKQKIPPRGAHITINNRKVSNMSILKLIENQMDKTQDVITGKLVSYSVNLQVKLTRINDRNSESAPHWEVWAKAPHGDVVKVGLAKEHEISRGENQGLSMLSIWFTDPEFAGVSFSAFPESGNAQVWNAQVERKRQAKQGNQQATQVEAADALAGDGIPF